MWVVSLVLLLPIIYTIYFRYVPVRSVKCVDYHQLDQDQIKVDLRDYNDSAKEEIDQSIALPVAYIKRFHHELPNGSLYVIAGSIVEKNIGVRLLKRRGYQVVGYTVLVELPPLITLTSRLKSGIPKNTSLMADY